MIYDPFQKEAIRHIDEGHSVIVSAPTGAGKTVIAEHVIRGCLARGEKVIYTAPIKALSNQKFRDFQAEDENIVGILTGDVSLNTAAPVQVMTTEIFRNKILEGDPSLAEYSWIIFDEIHYLDDYERGTVWEESLIFLPGHMRFLGLSATVPNVEELAAWLKSIHGREIRVVCENKRPVPLHLYYQCQGRVYDDLKHLGRQEFRQARANWRGKVPPFIPMKPNKVPSLMRLLQEEDRLPCIYFVFSRKRAQALAEELHEFDFLSVQEAEQMEERFRALCRRFDIEHEPSVAEIRPLLRRGIAYHHAGMLPTVKEVVEQLFTSRLIKAIFTTETFALGINMPARTVIFDELRKFYGRKFDTLRTRDFYQMAGRAGRRSMDTEGFVYCRINPHFISAEEITRVVNGRPEKICSQFSASYATILNLYRVHQERLYDVYPRSFHFFQTGKMSRRRAVDRIRARVDILKEMGHIQDNALTDKGNFARQVYGYELLLSELYGEGQLERLSVEELGILAAAAVYEPRKGEHRPDLPARARKLDDLCSGGMRRILRLEKAAGLREITKRPFFHLSGAVQDWMKGADFHAVTRRTEADEGEVVRYFRMAIQVLRQMADGNVSPGLESRIFQAIDLLKRDVIDSEKQLRS